MNEKSAGAIIFRKDKEEIKYLLLQYKFKTIYWDFPKGNVEEKEKDEDTVKREIKEETGIESIEILPEFKEKVNYFYKKGEQTIFKEVFYFLVETDKKKVKLSEEHIGYVWLDYEKALKKLTYENSRTVFKKANEFLKNKKQKQLFNFK